MSRIYIGIGILLVLLVLCSLSSFLIPRIHLDISQQLEQAALSAQQGNWPQASQLANRAMLAWEQAHGLTTVAADHEPTDEIDALFAELKLYAALEDTAVFAATALHLARLTAALGSSHSFSLWNLL